MDEMNHDSRPLIKAFCLQEDSNICERIVNTLKERQFNISLNIKRNETDEYSTADIVNIWTGIFGTDGPWFSFFGC